MKKSDRLHPRTVEIRLATDKILSWLKKFEGDEAIGSVIQALIQQRESEIRRGEK